MVGVCVRNRKKVVRPSLFSLPTNSHVGVGQQVGGHVKLAGEVPGVERDPAVLELVVAVWGGEGALGQGGRREPGARALVSVPLSLRAPGRPRSLLLLPAPQ